MCSGPRDGQGRTQETKAGYKFDINAKFNDTNGNEKFVEDITANINEKITEDFTEYRERGAAGQPTRGNTVSGTRSRWKGGQTQVGPDTGQRLPGGGWERRIAGDALGETSVPPPP